MWQEERLKFNLFPTGYSALPSVGLHVHYEIREKNLQIF
jgi:hypothetical protein